ncbi:hypothetical protein SLEP1_g56258 [Rubroshorea leprosula]|uniref:E3 ubiquitin-protein ligase CHFR cysteine rich domain-containing protein n=1 Tax=Rubroshorea leprosula TaxID=152421 RepID=A0AAV5MHT6_9ROSI|nr:hypothetical protein SLEP1_g56258 [Rubroshorea leprosula]
MEFIDLYVLQIAERTISRIPVQAHEMNQHEQDITDRCIRQAGRTLQDVIADWIRKLNNREIDRTRLQLNHAEMITAGTHLCKLLSFYTMRIGSHLAECRHCCFP